MTDIATIEAAISAATAAIGLIDKFGDQVVRFITKRPEPAVPPEYRMQIEEADGALVSRSHGQEVQRITVDDLKHLPEPLVRHVSVLEGAMERHYKIWAAVYPQLATMDGVQKAKVELQLQEVIRDMRTDLDGILAFLESCGLQLDDHYQHIRYLVREV
ncbi:hypothetical protein [Kitasatospora sp. KL5]|uniref:hypothetical protein n=1 Tax=Kitasatospora sp. KL5 TaxID=3425125 RepID=UPI003D6E746A